MEEVGGCRQPSRLAGGMEGFFFPQDPQIHHAIKAEHHRALGESLLLGGGLLPAPPLASPPKLDLTFRLMALLLISHRRCPRLLILFLVLFQRGSLWRKSI
ncbi:hypothetical protein ATANTOWER_018376 [Ataeniobius toweri]|uniref:Uncharacterized protein n=1 Tax=Ataeniobius toweri TaxID=208326 RepID=A0ABU7CHB9_9TELE|nr:hypothetical protein [Ataeniobius toweri]